MSDQIWYNKPGALGMSGFNKVVSRDFAIYCIAVVPTDTDDRTYVEALESLEAAARMSWGPDHSVCSVPSAIGDLLTLLSPSSFDGISPADHAELARRLWASHDAAAPEWRPLIAETLRRAGFPKPP